MINEQQLRRALTYKQYRDLLSELLAQGKTTGHDQGEDKIEFAKVNIQRMVRLDKTVVLSTEMQQALQNLKSNYTWVVLTEGWCGDTAQNIPVLHHIEESCPRIRLRLMLRDDNPEVMDQYLTNGARSIPKLICLQDDTLAEKFTWGPRPAPLQEKVMELVKAKVSKDEKGLFTQQWYNADKTITLQNELIALIRAHLR
jgi:hypothetical protein